MSPHACPFNWLLFFLVLLISSIPLWTQLIDDFLCAAAFATFLDNAHICLTLFFNFHNFWQSCSWSRTRELSTSCSPPLPSLCVCGVWGYWTTLGQAAAFGARASVSLFREVFLPFLADKRSLFRILPSLHHVQLLPWSILIKFFSPFSLFNCQFARRVSLVVVVVWPW